MALHIGILSQPGNFHCEKWARALTRAGAQVTIFTLDAPAPPLPGPEAVATVHVPPPVVWRGRYRYPSYALSARRLRLLLHQHRVDVLHPLHLTPYGTWGRLTGFRPMIAAAMGADVLEYVPRSSGTAQGWRAWAQAEVVRGPAAWLAEAARRAWYRHAVQRVIAHADLTTADNQPLVDAMRQHLGAPAHRTRLLRWGLEPELLAPTPARQAHARQVFGVPAGATLVLAPRGANALYQADVILHAWEALLQGGQHPGAYFLLLGAGYSISATVAAHAARLRALYPAQFGFIAHQVPRLDVYALWGITHIMISAPVYDGYSAALAEARYAGAVPVVNAIPGNLEVITHGHNGQVVHPFTAPALAQALHHTLQHLPQLQAQYGPLNRQWILQHSVVDANAARLLAWAHELHTLRAGLPPPA